MLRENGRNSEGYVCPLLTRLRQPGDHSGVRQRSPDDQFDRRCIVTDLETMLALSVIQNEMMKVADNLPGDASASKILGLVKNASSDRSGARARLASDKGGEVRPLLDPEATNVPHALREPRQRHQVLDRQEKHGHVVRIHRVQAPLRPGEATADKHTVDLSVGVVDVRRTVVLEKLSFLQIEGKGVHRATGLQDLGEHPPRGR